MCDSFSVNSAIISDCHDSDLDVVYVSFSGDIAGIGCIFAN